MSTNQTNQTAKHTPGSWTIHYNEFGHPTSVRAADHHVCVIRTNNQQKAIAYARLIAAAPELLEALVGACAIISTHVNMGAWEGEKEKEIYKNFWNKIESAITKATSTNPSNQSK